MSSTLYCRMECILCSGQFVETEHLPRNLRCGHVCCTRCLQQQVAQHDVVECNQCGSKQVVDSLDQLPLSKGLLDVISKMQEEMRKCCDNTSEESTIKSSTLHGSVLSLQSQEVMHQCVPQISEGLCVDHGYYRVFYCESCQVWVCRDCIITEHPRHNCQVKSARPGLDSMKTQVKEVMKQKISKYKDEIKVLEEFSEMVDEHSQVLRDTVDKIFKTLEKKKRAKVATNHALDQLEANLRELDGAKGIQEVRELVARFEESGESDGELDEEGREGGGAVANIGDGNEQNNDGGEEETLEDTEEHLWQRYGQTDVTLACAVLL